MAAMPDIRIGQVTVSSVFEIEHQNRLPEDFFIGATRAVVQKHYRNMPPVFFNPETGAFTMAFQSFLVRTPRHNILVDTCNGHDKFPTKGDTRVWAENLRHLGVDFGDIDFVFCTHLHVDHTGWNTTREGERWVPTFPNAKYIFSRPEYEYWEDVARSGVVPPRQRDGVWQVNCLPIVEAGQAIMIDDRYEIDETVSIMPTPGHSPGHFCVSIRSGGMEAIALGDLVHHPLQCCEPSWSTHFCWDPDQATQSRLRILNYASDNKAVLLPTHFPRPTAGTVERYEGAFRYHFCE